MPGELHQSTPEKPKTGGFIRPTEEELKKTGYLPLEGTSAREILWQHGAIPEIEEEYADIIQKVHRSPPNSPPESEMIKPATQSSEKKSESTEEPWESEAYVNVYSLTTGKKFNTQERKKLTSVLNAVKFGSEVLTKDRLEFMKVLIDHADEYSNELNNAENVLATGTEIRNSIFAEIENRRAARAAAKKAAA